MFSLKDTYMHICTQIVDAEKTWNFFHKKKKKGDTALIDKSKIFFSFLKSFATIWGAFIWHHCTDVDFFFPLRWHHKQAHAESWLAQGSAVFSLTLWVTPSAVASSNCSHCPCQCLVSEYPGLVAPWHPPGHPPGHPHLLQLWQRHHWGGALRGEGGGCDLDQASQWLTKSGSYVVRG